jgi:cbb3-type cytochrome oxidase subunit 3
MQQGPKPFPGWWLAVIGLLFIAAVVIALAIDKP